MGVDTKIYLPGNARCFGGGSVMMVLGQIWHWLLNRIIGPEQHWVMVNVSLECDRLSIEQSRTKPRSGSVGSLLGWTCSDGPFETSKAANDALRSRKALLDQQWQQQLARFHASLRRADNHIIGIAMQSTADVGVDADGNPNPIQVRM